MARFEKNSTHRCKDFDVYIDSDCGPILVGYFYRGMFCTDDADFELSELEQIVAKMRELRDE